MQRWEEYAEKERLERKGRRLKTLLRHLKRKFTPELAVEERFLHVENSY